MMSLPGRMRVLLLAFVLVLPFLSVAVPVHARSATADPVSTPGTPLIPPAQFARWSVLLGSPHLRHPTGLAIDTRGKPNTPKWAYTADTATGRVVKFGTGGKVLGTWRYGAPTTVGAPGPALAVGGSGNVFLANPGDGTIRKYSPAGRLLATWTGLNDPRSLAINRAGDVFVAEYGAHSVTELSPTGAVLTRWDMHTIWGSGSVGAPLAVAIDQPEGYLYVGSECFVATTCGQGAVINPDVAAVDWVLEFPYSGTYEGVPREFWAGIGHSTSGTPQGGVSKESEPFVTIDAMTDNRNGSLYVAGYLWPLGGTPAMGVVLYSSLGYKSHLWQLHGTVPIEGVAVDGRGVVYVTQGHRILRLAAPTRS